MNSPIRIFAILALMLAWGNSFSQDAEALYDQANDAYQAGEYKAAQALYDSIMNLGQVSADLYYNLGNTHYRQGHTGLSVLNYERALAIDPGHDDAQFNLKLARQRVADRIQPKPQFVLTRWWNTLTTGQPVSFWGMAAVLFMWLMLGAVALLLFGGGGLRRMAFVMAGVFALVSLGSLGLAINRQADIKAHRYAIVIAPNAYLKDAPDGPTDLMILHEGVKVERLDQIGEWVQVRISGANIEETEGFLKQGTLAGI